MHDVDPQAWTAAARADADATFFHTPLWGRVARAADPTLEDASFGGSLDDGTPFAYPLVARGRGRSRLAGLSSFAGCYGGPVAGRPLHAGELRTLHEAALERSGPRAELVLSPWASHEGIPEGCEAVADETHALDLTPEFEQLLAAASKGHRQAYRRSLREGIEVRPATPEEWTLYLDMYDSQRARLGAALTSEYRRETFEELARLAAEHPDAVRLWLSVRDGRPISGVWTFYWNRHVVIWHTAAHELGHGMVSPATALYGEVIRDARERGFGRFDLNPSGGLERVASFKRRFGASALPVLRLRHVARPGPAARLRAAARRLLGR